MYFSPCRPERQFDVSLVRGVQTGQSKQDSRLGESLPIWESRLGESRPTFESRLGEPRPTWEPFAEASSATRRNFDGGKLPSDRDFGAASPNFADRDFGAASPNFADRTGSAGGPTQSSYQTSFGLAQGLKQGNGTYIIVFLIFTLIFIGRVIRLIT